MEWCILLYTLNVMIRDVLLPYCGNYIRVGV